jgi:predicted O-linked N-acetylglucosamine transferase (SPINDLY family)
MGIATLRPAPVAVSWLGFPGTLGRDCYDYLLADAHVVPAGEERWYDETVVRLADCYQCNDRRRPRPLAATRAALGVPERAVVLCCFNQSFKITRDIFDAWLRILAAVPDAVLWLLEDNGGATAALRGHAAAAGIAPGRVVFAPRLPLADHLARYRVADLALDTFPCTSHTTASDALWMGCPLVTREGDTFAGRVATSLLRTLGLDEMVTADLASYEGVIRDLARDPEARTRLRARLRGAAEASPLFDSARFARALGAALLDIAHRGPAGQVRSGPA